MPDERHDAASNAQAAVRWAEREFATTNLIHGRDEERGGYSIIVRTSDDPLLTVNQLLMVTLLDEFLNNDPASEIARLLNHWQIGQAMQEVGRSQMELRIDDRFTDATGEWEVISRPYVSAGGKLASAHARKSGGLRSPICGPGTRMGGSR
jgi:hypothetical protein